MLNITRLPRVVQFLSNSREFWVTIHNEQSYRELCLMLKKLKKEKRTCRARSDRGQKSFSHLKQFFWNHWKWLKLQVSAVQKKLHRKGTASHADRKKIKNKWEKQPANQCPRYGFLVRHGYPTQPSKEKKVFFYLALTIYICFSSLNMQSSRKKLSPTVVPISIVQFQTDLAEGVCLTERRSCNFSDLARDAK